MKKGICIVALMLLAACEGGVTKTEDGAIAVMTSSAYGEVREIALSDGTNCAVLIGIRLGAISCDWK
jgi:ferric-dicitrate binding protein FerR (iron transport regulator)